MPKKLHTKFVVSADPYPAVDTTKSTMIYEPPDAEKQNNKQSEYEGDDQEWEVFLDSILKSNDQDLTLSAPGQSYHLDHNQIEFDYPDFFEYQDSLNTEYDYENGIRPELQSENISIDKLFDRDPDNENDAKDDDEKSIQEPPYSELLEDDWDIGMQ